MQVDDCSAGQSLDIRSIFGVPNCLRLIATEMIAAEVSAQIGRVLFGIN